VPFNYSDEGDTSSSSEEDSQFRSKNSENKDEIWTKDSEASDDPPGPPTSPQITKNNKKVRKVFLEQNTTQW